MVPMKPMRRIAARLLILAVLVSALVSVLGTTGDVVAQGKPVALPQAPDGTLAQTSRHILSDNFIVERGQVVDESVVVYSGNAQVKSGGRITGALVVMSGDVEIEEGAGVDGDVTVYSGDVRIDGRVGGNVSVMSGNVSLDDSARVEGDVSVLSGRIRRDDGAYVGGNVVQRPGLRAPATVAPSLAPGMVQADAPRTNLLGSVLGFIARVIGAVVLTGVVAALAAVLYTVWPTQVARARATLDEQRPFSFVVGLFGNLTVLFLAGILTVTICLSPLALILVLALAAVNLIGWTVASQIVGERVVKLLNQEVQPVLTIVVGAVLLTGATALLWVFGCLRPLAFLFMLIVASFGTGAFLVPWVNRRSGGATPPAQTDAEAGPSAPPASAAPSAVWQPPAESPAPAAPASPAQEAASDTPPAEDATATESQPPFTAEATPADEDVFTRIKGIGPIFERRLKSAGIRTFGELAATSPESIAEIIGWPVERVLRSEIREQAQRLAQGG